MDSTDIEHCQLTDPSWIVAQRADAKRERTVRGYGPRWQFRVPQRAAGVGEGVEKLRPNTAAGLRTIAQMPRDDWAKARSRDKAREAIRTGEYFRANTKAKRKPKKRKPASKSKRMFEIPAGTQLSICRVADSAKRWRAYQTRRRLSFERYETLRSGAYVFRESGWLLLVRSGKVERRS